MKVLLDSPNSLYESNSQPSFNIGMVPNILTTVDFQVCTLLTLPI
jgi:hypothetical protein